MMKKKASNSQVLFVYTRWRGGAKTGIGGFLLAFMCAFTLLVAGMGIHQRASAHELDAESAAALSSNEQLKKQCEIIRSRLNTYRNLDKMYECLEFYWHGGFIGYNEVLQIGYRILEVDPLDIQMYGAMAWLRYSKWVAWSKDPQDEQALPDGEKGLEQMEEIFARGERYQKNAMNADFHFEAGMAFWGLARFYKPEYYDRMIVSFTKMNTYAKDTKQRVRARLNTAHVYRLKEDNRNAISWYKKVLEIDPANASAKKYLEQLEQI